MRDDGHRRVLRHYEAADETLAVTPLGNAGGFSGARFWRIDTAAGSLCLRCWPREHPDRTHLSWMHQVLRHVHECGVTVVPVPQKTLSGETFACEDGSLWELTPWLSGKADYQRAPSDAKLVAAMQSLARWHQAAATMAGHRRNEAPSPSMLARTKRMHTMRVDGARQIRAAIRQNRFSVPPTRALEIVGQFEKLASVEIERKLNRAAEIRCLPQPVIRDVWHDHILFVGEQVSGIVDYGAMRCETVAGDVARLLGSLAGNDRRRWQLGQQAYETIRPLSGGERELVSAFDISSVLLAGLQWAEWLYVEGRQFEDWTGVGVRMEDNLRRLRQTNFGICGPEG